MRNRDAWLAAIATALGISEEACRRDAATQVQPVATVAASAASAPSVAASVEIAPSASVATTTTASVAPSASASVAIVAKPAPTQAPNLQELSQAICGAVPQNMRNASCGATTQTLRIPPGNGACGGSVGPGPSANPVRGPTAVIAVSLTGGASGDEHVATNFRPRFRACANQALAQDPSQQGRLVIVAAIGTNGDVRTADVSTNSGLSASSAQCMLRMVKNAQFPAGAARTVTLVINQTKQSP